MNEIRSALRLHIRHACALTLLSACAAAAWSQPTGNPKGTMAPSAQSGSGKPAPGNRSDGLTSTPHLDEKLGPSEARTQRTQPPGGGTAGGLTRRNPRDADPSGKGTTDRGSAEPRPASPR